ncbi:hypothetical protein NPIL_33801 [Nephila pilipes]|uniref:Uncharacterized protein n=1 Tax=Nephila pilipes TaxID=299642 RepID=A0A8X6UN54_NEPPI|nr:hypothetical protein NPIL_33801 [Nephila pilipes]
MEDESTDERKAQLKDLEEKIERHERVARSLKEALGSLRTVYVNSLHIETDNKDILRFIQDCHYCIESLMVKINGCINDIHDNLIETNKEVEEIRELLITASGRLFVETDVSEKFINDRFTSTVNRVIVLLSEIVQSEDKLTAMSQEISKLMKTTDLDIGNWDI